VKNLIIAIFSLLSGVVIGAIVVVDIFSVDVDLLGAPYNSHPMELQEPVVIKQEEVEILLPKGSIIKHRYSPKGQHNYSIEIISSYGDLVPKDNTDKSLYFYVKDNDS